MNFASILLDSKSPYNAEKSVIDKRVAAYNYMLSRAKQNLGRCRYPGGVEDRYNHADLNCRESCPQPQTEVKA